MNNCNCNREDATLTSVVITTHNRAELLNKAVRSILNQTYPNFEIIVIDDASDDDTGQVIKSFDGAKIIYHRNQVNAGLSAARNRALAFSSGQYIVFMDDDSLLKDDFLETLNKIVTENKIYALSARIVDSDSQQPYVAHFNSIERKDLGYFDFKYFMGGAHIIHRNVIKKVGNYDERFGVGSKYYASEESDYFFRIKQYGEKVLYCPELVIYHPDSHNPCVDKVFKYSYGIAAMLAKQITVDPRRCYIYFFILLRRLIVSLIRSIQYLLFPRHIEEKNQKYKYKYFFKGTLRGFIAYFCKNNN